jgi:predicted nuclease of predicted toxin-antitoxin system
MKLLLDQNISRRLVNRLTPIFPKVTHVAMLRLDAASDDEVWNFARENDFAIVSKDSDFNDRSFLYGFPPKVIWLRLGNCTTERIESTLRERRREIEAFLADSTLGVFALS